MNNLRRKQIKEALSLIEEAYDLLTMAKDEEEMAFDNLPESLQYSERGDIMQDNITNLDNAITGLDDAKSALENIE
ncbi:MAG: hypothetical protein PUK02_14585 [Parabacteroides sp.]|uniref:Uncharacterized protein n=1 Tax=Parabacteroides faecalis TaxID=2924040 RepID=A0ABT0C4Y5_9BACT|nr:hypothetical protein [Parabacteroides faecalis]MCI7287736.1 hypothetical protein [Parabacteroides sp.]MCJ2382073.1 hypothetical protein [Parabacteroides faecalis]MDD7562992.1 hypothetical protein [Parabacteroides sp.]MDY6254672.1 hypothetical protein [Bacteroidales bacterium]